MSPRVRAVAAPLNIALTLYLCILMSWADVAFCGRLVTGFRVADEIECPLIFRPTIKTAQHMSKEELLQDAREFVDLLEATMRPNKDPAIDKACWEQTEKDLLRGGAAGPYTRAQMDRKYGAGGWRPLKRFVIFQQHNQKYRAIDDGRFSSHNLAAHAEGRVHTSSHDYLLAILKRLHGNTARLDAKAASLGFERAELCVGLDDERSVTASNPRQTRTQTS